MLVSGRVFAKSSIKRPYFVRYLGGLGGLGLVDSHDLTYTLSPPSQQCIINEGFVRNA